MMEDYEASPPPNIRVDLKGERFESLLVTGFASRKKGGSTMWWTLCDCGRRDKTAHGNLQGGRSTRCKFCGAKFGGNRTHGRTGTPIYKVWTCIKKQGVVRKWETFVGFVKDMGTEKPEGVRLSRVNENRPHGPKNSKWVPVRDTEAIVQEVASVMELAGVESVSPDLLSRLRGLTHQRLCQARDKAIGMVVSESYSVNPITDVLRQCVKEMGPSRLSKLTGIDSTALVEFAACRKSVSLKNADRICAALGLCLASVSEIKGELK